MNCKGCGNPNAYQLRVYVDREGTQEVCNECATLSPSETGTPDVYLNRAGQTFESLCDSMGNPYPIMSKRHKKQVMDQLGVSEAGDRINGAPFGSRSWTDGSREWRKRQFEKDRPRIREAYRQWREKNASR